MIGKKYWMVHKVNNTSSNSCATKKMYYEKAEAILEAKRLTKEFLGYTFMVMEAAEGYCCIVPEPSYVQPVEQEVTV